MKGTNRIKLLSIILVLAYLLSACSGAAVQSGTPAGGKPLAKEVSFTGTVETLGSGEITVSGQTVSIDAKTVIAPTIKVGDIVKVEAQVSETGAVLALNVESFSADDTITNTSNSNDSTTNTNTNTASDNTNTNANDNTNTDNDNTNSNDNGSLSGGTEQEILGTVDALSADSVTVNGVVYPFSSFSEFKDAIFVGDNVKIHVIVNADGTLTVLEIETSDGAGTGDDNSNDDNGNDANSNEDEDDDNGNDDNSNDDDDDDDDNSNSNGNGNGG